MACIYTYKGKQYSEKEIKDIVFKEKVKPKDIKFATLDDIANILAYSNSKIILDGWKVEYSTPLGNKYDTLEEVNNEIRGLANANVEVDLSNIKVNRYSINIDRNNLPSDFIDNFKVIDNQDGTYNIINSNPWVYQTELDTSLQYSSKKEAEEIAFKENKSFYEKEVKGNIIEGFIEKNKEYEQSKEIIEQWKKENNIQYDPEEVYSRGQGFYSSIGAYSNLELDLLLKNLIQHIQDNKKAGGEFTISAFTKPIDKRLKHIEGTGDRVRFVIYPKSNHIKWAAPTDVYSGSVWDAHEKVSKDKKSELLGVSFTKAPALRNINEVSPNLADIIDNLSHVHNELGIELTTNNFRIEYDDNIDYSTKKLIDNINKILDDKYGKLVKPEIEKRINNLVFTALGEYNQDRKNSIIKEFKTKDEAVKWIEENKEEYKNQTGSDLILGEFWEEGKQPTQTKENTTSIKSVKSKYNLLDTEYGTLDLDKEELISAEDYLESLKTATIILNDSSINNEYVNTNKWFINIESTYPKGNFDTKKEAEDYLKNKIQEAQNSLNKLKSKPKKEYTQQALTNLKVAALKEVARKYPRSLITSKVVPINPNMVDNSEIQYSKVGSKQDIERFKDFVQSKQFQKLTAEEKAKTIEQVTKEQNNSLFGLNTQNQEQLEFHINTLNVVSKFLENAGIETRLVSEFLSQDGSVVEGAIAAANFIEGTVDIIDDLNKGRVEAWNKLPEEAAHWWYRLLDTNSPLKKALWESHQTALKNDELYKTQYGKLVKSPSDLTEESIGQLIAEAIKRIETKNANASDYSFFKKFLEWINSIIDIFKDTAQDPFEVAAMKILSSDMSDLMTWEEYRKLNNIVNFADVVTEQSVAPLDYTILEDLGKLTYLNPQENALNLPIFSWKAYNVSDDSPLFNTQEELDSWVYQKYGKEYDKRQKQILQEVRDNQIFFDRLLNKTFRKKSKFLPKTLRKYFDIIDAQNLNQLREWNISQELQQITKKLSEQEKKQIIETNGYTNIAPTLKVLPDLLQKYKKNPIILSEPVKIDGAKKQELSILNGIREMIKLENPNLKSITAEEFVAEAHNWLETNYLLGFANEKSYLSYRTDQTFTYLKDRVSDEDFQLGNMTEEEIQRLPFEERQRIANIVGLTKQNPDVYHNKVSLRFNDMYHLKSGHFDKSPSAWGNLTYFYTGKSKWKDAVLLHEIQNDNIEALREFKVEKVDLETSLGRYLQQLNTDLIDNITQIESGNKRIQKNDIFSTNPPRQHFQLNHQLQQLYNLPLEQGLNQLKQRLNESIELYKSDNSKNPEKAQEAVDKAYSQRRIFQDFKKRGGIKSLLTKEELEDLKNILHQLNTEEVEGEAQWLPDENQFEPGFPSIRNLKQKKADFKNKTIKLQAKLTRELQKMYGDNAPLINLFAPAKPLPKSQRRNQIVNRGTPRERRIGNASQELNENVNFLIAFSEQQIIKQLSKNIEETKKNYISARNATTANNFNVALSKITPEQYATLIDNYKYNEALLNILIDEQAQKDINSPELQKLAKAKSIISYLGDDPSVKLGKGKYGFMWDTADTEKGIIAVWDAYKNANTSEDSYIDNWTVDEFLNYVKEVAPEYLNLDTKSIDKQKQQSQFESLKQKALDKKAELEKNYGKIEEEVKQTLEIEMNYFTPLVHYLIQKHINQYGKDFSMYFSGYQITKLTQGNDRTALIYAGKDEINIVNKKEFKYNEIYYKSDDNGFFQFAPFLEDNRYFIENNEYINIRDHEQFTITEQEYNKAKQEYEKAYQQATKRRAKEIKFIAASQIGIVKFSDFENTIQGISEETNIKKLSDKQLEEGIKKLNEYKKQSKQNMDRVINTIMNISNSKPIETGAIYNAMAQISGVKLIWQDKIDGLQGNTGGYLVDLSNYNYNTPILYGLYKKSQNIGYKQELIDEAAKNTVAEENVDNKLNSIVEIFNKYPELSKIGTYQEYSEYLDTIFPNSKIKDIVYHGTMEQLLPKDGNFKGYITYFTTDKKYAETFGVPVNRKVVEAVLDIKDPYNSTSELADVPEEIHDKDEYTNPRIIKATTKGFDSVIGVDAGQEEGKTIAVFNPEQIHILGSKQDIEGFKKFTKRQSNDINNQENNNIEQSQINENNTESFTKESLNKKIDELLKSGEIYYTDDDSKPCAANGLRNTVKGTDWKIATEFKGKSHAQGGIDITLNENGYHFRRGGKDIKAANGLIIENK